MRPSAPRGGLACLPYRSCPPGDRICGPGYSPPRASDQQLYSFYLSPGSLMQTCCAGRSPPGSHFTSSTAAARSRSPHRLLAWLWSGLRPIDHSPARCAASALLLRHKLLCCSLLRYRWPRQQPAPGSPRCAASSADSSLQSRAVISHRLLSFNTRFLPAGCYTAPQPARIGR